jgi:hypothetical protein
MANSTYYATVNRILQRHGQTPFASTGVFDSESGISSIQKQAKLVVDEANRMLANGMPAEFLRKRGSITTTSTISDNTTGYSLSCLFESVIPKTWFITTSGSGTELREKDYTTYLREDPDGRTTQGKPIYVIPRYHDAVGDADKVMFDPHPDDVYTVVYQYYAEVTALSSNSDTIILPVRHEAALWHAAGRYLEACLGEGKVSEAMVFMQETADRVRQQILGMAGIAPKAELSFSINGLRRTGHQDSAWAYYD